jgi:hypothetical protein
MPATSPLPARAVAAGPCALLLLAALVSTAPDVAGQRPPAPAPRAAVDPATDPAADSAAVAATLTRFFDALRVKDAATVRATLHPDARFTLLRPAPDGGVRVNVITAAQFIESTTGPDARGLDEPIRHIRVSVDGALATAWAEYQVRVNGTVSHCGHDAFHLVRTPAGWQVLNTADSYRRDGCGPAWP